MTAAPVALTARAFAQAQAIRQVCRLHRRLSDHPIGLILFQLAGEPFGVTAIRFGTSPSDDGLIVCPDPRNRDLLFAALQPFAEWFCSAFEEPSAHREADGARGEVTTGVPQIIVANRGTLGALEALARRTAYLSDSGDYAADPALIQMGRHLQWAVRHTLPGQQVLLALTELLNDNWVTPMSDLEAQSLPALDAFIDPQGRDAFEAAWAAEDIQMGPLASAESDRNLAELVERFHAARREADAGGEQTASHRIRAHLEQLVQPAWETLWRCLARERALPEAPSVERRVLEDRRAYTAHMDWQAQGGRRRTSETARQAAWLRHRLEEARSRLEAEEAIDDPLRMVPFIVDGRAILGTVVSVDQNNYEQGPKNRVARPLVVVECEEPVVLPLGAELRWTAAAGAKEWTVREIRSQPGGGSLVTLRRGSGTPPRTVGVPFLPGVGDDVVFSEHSLGGSPPFRLPADDPWTHRPPAGGADQGPIEDGVE